jgi:hypothetical protein
VLELVEAPVEELEERFVEALAKAHAEAHSLQSRTQEVNFILSLGAN